MLDDPVWWVTKEVNTRKSRAGLGPDVLVAPEPHLCRLVRAEGNATARVVG